MTLTTTFHSYLRRLARHWPPAPLQPAYTLGAYRRIYLYHIRKTGGTSLIQMFLRLSGADAGAAYRGMCAAPTRRHRIGDKWYVGWDVPRIEQGAYFFAFSHTPAHGLRLPPHTYTVTCLRDQIQRVLSHYHMLRGYLADHVDHPCLQAEGRWATRGLADFSRRVEREHLLNQLYMFSPGFHIDEALENLSRCSCVMLAEHFSQGVAAINRDLGLQLQPVHERKGSVREEIPQDALDDLRERLEPEYALLAQLEHHGIGCHPAAEAAAP